MLNASVDGNRHRLSRLSTSALLALGSAARPGGAILRNADQLSFADIEKKIAEFGQKAKDGKLSIDELSGGTFSIKATAAPSAPCCPPHHQPAAVRHPRRARHEGPRRGRERPGRVRPINYLAMSYDHRIIDGREAVLGLVTMKEALEDPARLLFDI